MFRTNDVRTQAVSAGKPPAPPAPEAGKKPRELIMTKKCFKFVA